MMFEINEQYYKEVGKHKNLSITEQLELGKRIQEGCIESKNRLIECNLKYVVKVAREYWNKDRTLDIMDIIEEGNLGLIHATTKYDYTKGYAFLTYADNWIRNYIQRGIMDKDRFIKLPSQARLKLYKLRKVRAELMNTGKEPMYEDIVKKAGLSESDGKILQPFLIQRIEVETDIEYNQPDAFEDELSEEVLEMLDGLSDRSRDVVIGFFGLDGNKRTLEDMGEQYGITRQSIFAIKEKALKKMRRKAMRMVGN